MALTAAQRNLARAQLTTQASAERATIKAEREFAEAKHETMTASRVARDAEAKYAFAVAEASSSSSDVGLLHEALVVEAREFQRQHPPREATQEWAAFLTASEAERRQQAALDAFQQSVSVEDMHKGVLVQALINELKLNVTREEWAAKLKGGVQELAQLKRAQAYEAARQEPEAFRTALQLKIAQAQEAVLQKSVQKNQQDVQVQHGRDTQEWGIQGMRGGAQGMCPGRAGVVHPLWLSPFQ